MNYYDITEFNKVADDFGAKIRIIMGQRGNGKTYQVVKGVIKDFDENGHSGLYVRRWSDDLKGSLIEDLFTKHNPSITYRNKRFYKDGKTICRTVSLSQSEHFKGTVIPYDCKTVIFDEIFPEGRELPNEFARWQSILSTAVRDRDDIIVYMLGNTIRRTSCYFDNYKIDPKRLKKGQINLVTVKNKSSSLKLAIDWCEKNTYVTRNSNAYFVNISAENMLLNGDFESSPHHIERYLDVTIQDWNKAKAIPICFKNGNVFYEFRVYKNVLIVSRGTKKPIVFSNDFFRSNGKTLYVDCFPFASFSSFVRDCQSFIYDNLKQNTFLCDSIETGEIVQEMVGAKKQ